jgi:hypothetical protein
MRLENNSSEPVNSHLSRHEKNTQGRKYSVSSQLISDIEKITNEQTFETWHFQWYWHAYKRIMKDVHCAVSGEREKKSNQKL